MNTQELAIIVPSVTALLVLAGNLWYQRWLTDRTLVQQALVTEKTLDHERSIARDQRVQERIAGTYEDLLVMVDYVMEVARATQPILEPGPPPPAEPDRQEARRVQARIGAHGSPEVKAIVYERWVPIRIAFFNAAGQLAQMRQADEAGRNVEEQYRIGIVGQYQKVQALRVEFEQIVRQLEDRVNEELRQ